MESFRTYGEIVQSQYHTILKTYDKVYGSPRFTETYSPERTSRLEAMVKKIGTTYRLLMSVVDALEHDDLKSSDDLLTIQIVAGHFSQEVKLFISLVEDKKKKSST